MGLVFVGVSPRTNRIAYAFTWGPVNEITSKQGNITKALRVTASYFVCGHVLHSAAFSWTGNRFCGIVTHTTLSAAFSWIGNRFCGLVDVRA